MRVVFFDLFDTLVTQVHPDRPAQQVFADQLGVPLEDARRWWKESVRGRMVGDFATYEETLREMVRSIGATMDEDRLAEICLQRVERKRSFLVDVDAAVIELLSHLKATEWRVGIVSNATPDELACWQESPIANLVEDAVFSCRVGCMKPEAAIYTLACDRFDVSPSDVIFVGDGGFDELPGAAAVGMLPIQAQWYRDREINWKSQADLIGVRRIEEVGRMLEEVARRGEDR